jgi:hypothetical protein
MVEHMSESVNYMFLRYLLIDFGHRQLDWSSLDI